jgi:hypothetical protein
VTPAQATAATPAGANATAEPSANTAPATSANNRCRTLMATPLDANVTCDTHIMRLTFVNIKGS